MANIIDSQPFSAGTHSVDFTARGFAQGTYFYRLGVIANGKTIVDAKKIVIGA